MSIFPIHHGGKENYLPTTTEVVNKFDLTKPSCGCAFQLHDAVADTLCVTNVAAPDVVFSEFVRLLNTGPINERSVCERLISLDKEYGDTLKELRAERILGAVMYYFDGSTLWLDVASYRHDPATKSMFQKAFNGVPVKVNYGIGLVGGTRLTPFVNLVQDDYPGLKLVKFKAPGTSRFTPY